MSWSVTIIGKPEKVVQQLADNSATLTGQSKTEYEEALPHLQALVSLCIGPDLLINLTASGHANFDAEGKKTYRNVQVQLSQFYAKLAI